jgi:serine/threonine protein kinase/Rieske Fe-S protein
MQQTLLVDQLVGQMFGEYRVERLLGRGRLSAVYLAQHPAQHKHAALTTFILPPQFSREECTRFLARFHQEATQLTTLFHRHLLQVYAYGEQFGFPYLVTPYMTEGSLADVLKQQGRCTPAYVLSVLEQIASGLDYAHAQGVVHGSLKPSNILLNGKDNILVAGFGLANMLQMRGIVQLDQPNMPPYAHLLSIAGTFLGSPEYLAPEVVQGQPMDKRSDMYALGIVLFELLTGRVPFTGTSPLEVARQHVQRPLPSLRGLAPDIPVALEFVVQHALARNPDERFHRVSELAEAFAQVCRGTFNNTQPLTGTSPLRTTAEREVASTGAWQLRPPVITDKNATVRMTPESDKLGSLPGSVTSISSNTTWQLKPPIATGKVPAFEQPLRTKPALPAPAPMPPAQPMQAMRLDQTAPPAMPPMPAAQPAPYGTPQQGVGQSEWWSQVAPPQPPQPVASPAPTEPTPLRLPQPVPQSLPQQGDPFQMRHDPFGLDPGQYRSVAKRKRPVGRRRVVAMLATGGVVAAGVLLAGGLEFRHLFPHAAPTASATTHTPPSTAPQGNQSTPTATNKGPIGTATPQQPMATPTQAPTHTGQVIGSTALTLNTAMAFTNPTDSQGALLIHLPNNNFVAYERACTHVGVAVNYDPGTHMLICPAHGSIFNPADNGAVVQGPAMRPLPAVAIHVNTDGTITV